MDGLHFAGAEYGLVTVKSYLYLMVSTPLTSDNTKVKLNELCLITSTVKTQLGPLLNDILS